MRFRLLKRKLKPANLPPVPAESFIQQADALLKCGYTHAAGCMLRLAIEKEVRQANESLDDPLLVRTSRLITHLRGLGLLNKPTARRYQKILDVGNKSAHGKDIEPSRVRAGIDWLSQHLHDN